MLKRNSLSVPELPYDPEPDDYAATLATMLGAVLVLTGNDWWHWEYDGKHGVGRGSRERAGLDFCMCFDVPLEVGARDA